MHICVFCASSDQVAAAYFALAKRVGELLAQRSITLVYGGGKIGLMGVLATTVHQLGGRVIGVIPSYLRRKEIAYEQADELVVTENLSQRKEIMFARANGFLILPGGFGTLEEALEIITLKLLRQHEKPVVFLNAGGFFDPLFQQGERLYVEGFLTCETKRLYEVAPTPEAAIEYLSRAQSPIRDDRPG